MAKLFPRKLPRAPSGSELLDLVWASHVHLAPYLFEGLPAGVDPKWATSKGVRALWVLMLAIADAKAELDRTPLASILRRQRERRVQWLEQRTFECTGLICAALAAAARSAHRKASQEQVWVLVFEGFKRLAHDSRDELAELARR